MIFPIYQFLSPQGRYTQVSGLHSLERIDRDDIVLFISESKHTIERSNLNSHYFIVLTKYGLREIASMELQLNARLIG